VQQRVSRILSTLPAEVEEPSYAKLDLNDVPVLNLAVSGPAGGDPTELYRVANDIARPALETSPGVGRVVVIGGQKPEVHVEVQPDRLRAYGLTLNDVTNAVQSQFINTSAGQATNPAGTQRASVRVTSGIADLYTLGNVTVSSPDGSVSTELRNVATVSLGGEDARQLLRVNGQPAAGLLVYKQSNANITQAVDAARPTIEQINAGLPAEYRVEIVIYQSTIIRQTVRGVGEELVLAAIIARPVLFFFLHSLRSTAIVVLAIPISLRSR
jgi:multidrug efflux pump subunit AcrB